MIDIDISKMSFNFLSFYLKKSKNQEPFPSGCMEISINLPTPNEPPLLIGDEYNG